MQIKEGLQINVPELNFFETRPFVPEIDGAVSALGETQTQRDLREIGELQSQFDIALRRKYDKKDMLQRSYNPVVDRWRIEKLRSVKDKAGEDAYVKEIHVNLQTNLKERMQVADNVVRYSIGAKDLYSEHFPMEPFGQVLERGAEYRLQHGSPEPEREGPEGERGGWEKISFIMTDPKTPIGRRITSFSPEGRVKDSSYDRNVVDEYELVEDMSGKYVKLTRTVVDFDEADYLSAALSLDPKYFDEYDGRPLDAWMLSHPVVGSIPDLADRQKGISGAAFEKMYDSGLLKKIEERFAEEITKEKVDWRQVALIFNAYYNQADKEEKRVLGGEEKEHSVYLSQRSIEDTINSIGWKKPEEKGGAGCPTSKGFSMSNGSLFGTYGNSVAWFGPGGGGGSKEWFSCPACSYKANGPVGNRCPGCKITKEDYATKSSNEMCD